MLPWNTQTNVCRLFQRMFWVNSSYRVWQWRWRQRASSDGTSSAPPPSGPNSWRHRVLKVTGGHHGITASPRAAVPPPPPPHSAMTSQADSPNTGSIQRGQTSRLHGNCSLRPGLCLSATLCGKNERMRVVALQGHVLPCQQHILLQREAFRFMAFIGLFLLLGRRRNDELLFAGRNYFHICSFICTLISTNVLTDKIFSIWIWLLCYGTRLSCFSPFCSTFNQ